MLTDHLCLWGRLDPASCVARHRASFKLTLILLRCTALATAVALVWGAWLTLSALPSYVDACVAAALALAWAYRFERHP